ncbi:MAG: RNase adaptor protein RapZ, partial [Acidobacteria bacterium]
YSREGKSYLTIGIGCTGGRHRSVMLANELKQRLTREGRKINLIHRDLHLR